MELCRPPPPSCVRRRDQSSIGKGQVMGRQLRLRELILGYEGLALLRNAVDGDSDFVNARLGEIRRFMTTEDHPVTAPALEELDPSVGYAAWSTLYDDGDGCELLDAEQPLVHSLLDQGPGGDALDAACGSGRQTEALTSRGYRAVGVDQSPEMLALARRKVPEAEFRLGNLEQLPVDADSVDLALCSLALTNLPTLAPAVSELARVVRPGGRVIISDLHPMMALLQGQPFFSHGSGQLAFVRNHVHLVSEYLAAFAASGLDVTGCMEPLFTGRLPAGGFEAELIPDAARAAWEGIPSAIVWNLVAPA
jgi:SAM-dependent methyltransferase